MERTPPEDDGSTTTDQPKQVSVATDDLKEVLDFVEWDSALDSAPQDSDVLAAIASLRDDLDQTANHPKVERIQETN